MKTEGNDGYRPMHADERYKFVSTCGYRISGSITQHSRLSTTFDFHRRFVSTLLPETAQKLSLPRAPLFDQERRLAFGTWHRYRLRPQRKLTIRVPVAAVEYASPLRTPLHQFTSTPPR